MKFCPWPVSLESENFAKNREKEGENQEKPGKKEKSGKEDELGRFFHVAPPDR